MKEGRNIIGRAGAIMVLAGVGYVAARFDSVICLPPAKGKTCCIVEGGEELRDAVAETTAGWRQASQ